MKHLIGLFVCLVLIVSVTAAFAAPVGNIAIPSKGMLKKGIVVQDLDEGQFSVVMGPEVDFIFDRKLEGRIGDNEFTFGGAKTGVTIANRALVYVLLGAGEAEQEFSVSGRAVKYDCDTGFVWGVGGSVIAWEYEPFVASMDEHVLRIGVDVRYRRIDLDVEEVAIDGTKYKKSETDPTLADAIYEANEWQIAPVVSYQFNNIVPYFGLKYSNVDGDAKASVSGTEYKQDLEADYVVGIFLGIDITLGDSVSFNVEGRFIDEEALTLSANVRF